MDDISRNWQMLVSLLPAGWQGDARSSGAVERLRGFASVDAVLRCLLLHVGCGYSLRETSVRAHLGRFAQVSDVTLLNRLRQSEEWLHRMCRTLLEENGVDLQAGLAGRVLRLVDGTQIHEPGRTGSQWRIHFSLVLPSLRCDYLDITPVKGKRNHERLDRFPSRVGELILADRGFCRAKDIVAVHQQGADVLVRVGTVSLITYDASGERFDWLAHLREVSIAGAVREWPVWIEGEGGQRLQGRLCALRKSEEMIERSLRKLRRRAQLKQAKTRSATRLTAAYVVVFTTVPAEQASAQQVLECYRLRWQIELVFKRLKSILQLGHLPKHDEQSSRAWLYGKLVVALLGDKIRRLGVTISPWGYVLGAQSPPPQRVA